MRTVKERIDIYPYNLEWKSLFIKEEGLLRLYLNEEYKSIIHIGSTSIEGMAAKPIIDISVAVVEDREAKQMQIEVAYKLLKDRVHYLYS